LNPPVLLSAIGLPCALFVCAIFSRAMMQALAAFAAATAALLCRCASASDWRGDADEKCRSKGESGADRGDINGLFGIERKPW